MGDVLSWGFAAAYGAIGVVLLTNLWYLARHRRQSSPFSGRLSVLVPARNEEAALGRLLPSLLAQRGVDFEVVVYDDASDDATASVVRQLADPRVRLVGGTGPPPGWVGKVHALYQAARHATGSTLLFLDADTRFTDDRALSRIVERFAALPAGRVLTALPHFRGGAPLLVSLVPFGLLSTLPLGLSARLGGRYLSAMNGQCWLIGRDTYLAHEPHLRHRGEVLEDVRIGQFLASRGVRPTFADVQDDLEVWMYDGMPAAWRGFRKNTYLLMGGRPLPFLAALGLFVAVFLVGPAWSPWWLAWAVGAKLAADRFSRFPLWVSVLAPLSFLLWSVLMLDSALSHARGRVEWKGRDVALGSQRSVSFQHLST